MNFLRNLYYSFPFQLFLLQLKKQQVLLFFWVVLFGVITKVFARKFGVPFLLLDPEYLGQVGFVSFLFVGTMFGAFVMSWNITTYILHSFRFPFMATLERPFAKYCLNNSILPGSFILIYIWAVISFQTTSEFMPLARVAVQLLGFLSGFLGVIFLSFTYFMSINKNLFYFFKPRPETKKKKRPVLRRSDLGLPHKAKRKVIEVKYYLSHPFRIRRVRSVAHYDESQISFVFRNHHLNALVIELISLSVIIVLGLLIDQQAFRIPAGASILLISAIMVMFIGAFSFWLRAWRTIVFIVMFVLLNYLIQFEVFESNNMAYGLDYSSRVEYTTSSLNELNSKDIVKEDIQGTYKILNNWLVKNQSKSVKEPRMVIINTTGGGLRSAAWTFHVVQQLDSLMDGELFDNTFLITGASAGLIGSAYYRELDLRRQEGEEIDPSDPKHYEAISKDILNPVAYSLFVNDVFFPIRRFEIEGKSYLKDRGYMFEKQINENTSFIMNKKLMDYQEAEQQMKIPILIAAPTITNDGRKLYISAQPISYLTRPIQSNYVFASPETDGVEFMRLFKDNQAEDLLFTSALRMNATFPYITPNVILPTEPVIEVMDAGMRDNFGIGTTTRFISVFKEWLRTYTGGVVIIQIRDSGKQTYIERRTGQTFIDKMFNPIGSFYQNWDEFQDYNNDNLVDYASEWLDGKLDLVRFEYIPSSSDEAASLSWHLTTSEKNNIQKALRSTHNQRSLDYLLKIMKPSETISKRNR
jgi:hypothetical protein